MDNRKKILILTMSCNQEAFLNEENTIKETWAKDIIDGKYPNITWYAYRSTLNDNPYDMDNIIYVPENDDRSHTYQKTIACFKYINDHKDKDKFDFDFIVRTNTSQYVNVELLNKFVDGLDPNDETIYTSQICFNTSSHLKLYGRGNFVLFSRVVFDRILKASELYPYGGNKDLYIDDFVIANQLEKSYFDNEPLKQSIDYIKQIPYLQNEKTATSTYNFELFKDKIGINLRCFRRENMEKHMRQVHRHIKEETNEFVCSKEYNKGIVVFFDDDKLTSKGMSYAAMKNYLYEKGIYKEELDSNNDSKVSIVIPLYNAEKYISDTIDSVLSQKYTNWECLIVNDGSTDNSEKVVLEKIKGNDKFKYLSQKNSGPGKARNYGASMASGKYLLFLDADDIILDDYLLDGVNFLDANANYSLFYGKANIFWDNGTEKLWPLRKFRDMKDFLKSNCIYCTAMIRKKDFDEVGGFDEDLKAFEDWEFFIRLLDRNPKVFREDKILFKYRRHAGSRDDINKNNWTLFRNMIYLKNKAIFDKWNNNVH